MNSRSSSRSFLIRVLSDQNSLPVPRNISLVATPFIASEHQGIHRKLLFTWLFKSYKIFKFQNSFYVVEISGFEPLTSAVQKQRSTNWAIPPWWAIQDLNLGPHPYQGCALTNWANSPNRLKLKCWIKLVIYFFPKRRWSSRTFQYGYLVTTSPQSLALP